MRLRDKVAIITGAAAGIGRATAELFAEEGASVVLLDKDPAGAELAHQMGTSSRSALFIKADISKEKEIRQAIELTDQTYGRVDILVNNAAVFVLKGLEASPHDWHQVIDVNLIGTALCARHVSKIMKRNKGGAIVNLGSISSFVAQPGFLTYSATKAALVNMTRCMAMDLAPYNIRVNCVCPGTIRTSATERHLAKTGMSEAEFVARNAPLHLLNRIGQPREVAYAILFLASDEASFITATPLMVDGGYTAT
jgi:NAD(P)-dependent dehydrogenase (short-subunit alcohol dehydrogenase family)